MPASEKIVSLFEPHTDIIVKGQRKVRYGHKVNLATQAEGFVTYLKVESGNPADSSLFMPVLEASEKDYGTRPREVVADGGYASKANVIDGRKSGVDRLRLVLCAELQRDADGAFGIRIGRAVLTDRHKEAVDRWSRRQGQGRTRFKNPKNRMTTFKPARIKGCGKDDQEGGSARKTTPDSAIKNPLFLDGH